jgi:hypothetical protein
MTLRRACLVAGFALIASCGPRPATLTIDLVTDLVPAVEVFSVRTTLTPTPASAAAMTTTAVLTIVDDGPSGVRVAELRALALGSYRARVELLDVHGAVLVERGVDVLLSGNLSMRVVVTRDCVSVACPGPGDAADRTECLGGRCVVPTCFVPSECMSRECETDGDCPTPGVSCAVADCRDGVCFDVEVRGMCGDGMACDPDEGCVVIPDPPPDGGGSETDGAVGAHDAGSVSGDRDGDGFGPDDCDDTNANVYPGGPEDCNDGVDQDCSGSDLPCPPDLDGDGWDAGSDCDDGNPAINPAAEEVCGNAVDENCDFVTDCGSGVDADGDGISPPLDCNDASATVYPHAIEICGDGIDQDCRNGDRPIADCTGAYLETCGPHHFCEDAPDEHLACVGNQCQRCCAFCENRLRFHWVNVDHDCADAARAYCAVGDRGGLSTSAPDAIQWGGCRP